MCLPGHIISSCCLDGGNKRKAKNTMDQEEIEKLELDIKMERIWLCALQAGVENLERL